jgi:transmembrane sensor
MINQKLDIKAAAYLSGELNKQEKAHFEELLRNDAKLNQEIQLLSQLWNKMEQKNFDTDAAWDNLSARIDSEKPIKKRKNGTRMLIGIAAASIIVFGLLTIIVADFLPGNDQLKYIAEHRMEIQLPDNSKVILQKGTKLTLDEHFNTNSRTVNLKGKAWFEVKPNNEIPFIIQAARCEVKVVGTEFSVDSRPNMADKVVVKSGEVMVTHKFIEQSVNLKANDNVAITNETLTENIPLPDNYLSWVFRKFYFSNNTLNEVCADLNGGYDKQIKLKNREIGKMKLSATFQNQTIDEIAQIIAETHNLKISSDKQFIILSKK